MTAGSVSIKNFSWAIMSKKRHRSGSGGSKDHEPKKKSLASKRQQSEFIASTYIAIIGVVDLAFPRINGKQRA